MKRQARPETVEFLEACFERLPDQYARELRFAATCYVLDGWEERYPFPEMPEWLQPRYWSAELVAALKLIAEVDEAHATTEDR